MHANMLHNQFPRHECTIQTVNAFGTNSYIHKLIEKEKIKHPVTHQVLYNSSVTAPGD